METFAFSRVTRPGNLVGLDYCISGARIDPEHTSGSDRMTVHYSNRMTGHHSNSRIGRNIAHARWRLVRSQATQPQLPRRRAKQRVFSSLLHLPCPALIPSFRRLFLKRVQCRPSFSRLGNCVTFSQKLYLRESDEQSRRSNCCSTLASCRDAQLGIARQLCGRGTVLVVHSRIRDGSAGTRNPSKDFPSAGRYPANRRALSFVWGGAPRIEQNITAGLAPRISPPRGSRPDQKPEPLSANCSAVRLSGRGRRAEHANET